MTKEVALQRLTKPDCLPNRSVREPPESSFERCSTKTSIQTCSEDSRSPTKQASHTAIPHLLDAGAAAVLLNLSPATLAKWRVKGGGPRFVRIGKRILYQQDALAEFLSGRVFSSTAEYATSAVPRPKR